MGELAEGVQPDTKCLQPRHLALATDFVAAGTTVIARPRPVATRRQCHAGVTRRSLK
jgi:hypothetical protein